MSRFLDYREAAERVSEKYFRISPRTIDTWPDLRGRIINRKVWLTREEVDAAAERRIRDAEARRAAALESATV
jgi:hypothetical protein